MKKIIYSAPAKVILSGEHAVVYGKPALVSAINLRLAFILWEENIKIKDSFVLYIADHVKNYLIEKKIKYKEKKFNFKIESTIPQGKGLGSSAALSVAATAAFLEFYTDKKFSKKIINEIALKGEKYFHQNPSGVDVTASCFGGLIYYRREFDFLRQISFLSLSIPQSISDNLYLIDTGRPEENTGQMVKKVAELYKQKQKFIEQVFNNIEKTTKQMVISLENNNSFLFAKSLIDNEILLEKLSVVSNKTKKLLENLKSFGAGKITGAGGYKDNSGYILFFARKKKDLLNFLKQNHLSYFSLTPDKRGLVKIKIC